MREETRGGWAAVVAGAVAAVVAVGVSSAQTPPPGPLDPVGVTDGGVGGGVGGTGADGVGVPPPVGVADAGLPEIPDPAIPDGTDLPDNTFNRPQTGTEAVPPPTGVQPPTRPFGADGGM